METFLKISLEGSFRALERISLVLNLIPSLAKGKDLLLASNRLCFGTSLAVGFLRVCTFGIYYQRRIACTNEARSLGKRK